MHCCRPQWSNSGPSIPKQCELSAVVTFHATALIVTRTKPMPAIKQCEILALNCGTWENGLRFFNLSVLFNRSISRNNKKVLWLYSVRMASFSLNGSTHRSLEAKQLDESTVVPLDRLHPTLHLLERTQRRPKQSSLLDLMIWGSEEIDRSILFVLNVPKAT